MKPIEVDVAIVGAGQAGLGTAYHLSQAGLDYVVLERGRIGETWRSQRWDSFTLNTPNAMNGLPGADYNGPDPLGFMTHTELVTSFEEYVTRFDLPVRTGVTVTGVRRIDGTDRFEVSGQSDADGPVRYLATSVVIASGIMQTPRIPAFSSAIPAGVTQLHTGDYRSPGPLPPGAVVVVGGGQSGAQIVEDLLAAGRTLYFSISKVARVPRSYRGRDFMDWWIDMGMWEVEPAGLDNPADMTAANPTVSGVGPRGHTISYQQLVRDGATLMGRLQGVEGSVLTTDDRVMEYIANADDRSQMMKNAIDRYIETHHIDAPPAVADPADTPVPPGEAVPFITELDLASADVGTVIWSTGFSADFSWIDPPVTGADGRPDHDRGVSIVDGVYFIGFPWLSTRKSGIVFGIEDDARHITKAIVERASRMDPAPIA
jgi:putative flavoprotein involved in K+ transport